MATLRAAWLLTIFVLAAMLAIIWQGSAILLKSEERKMFPRRFHSFTCRLFGIRLHLVGEPPKHGGVLVVANHCSYLDIFFLGAFIDRLSFISRHDVGSWPVIGLLVRLQESVLIERRKRRKTGEQMQVVRHRLEQNDVIAIFAEGTTSDGNRILPFKSSLIGAAVDDDRHFPIYPVSITLVGLHGMPISRPARHYFSWSGDATLVPHIWQMLKAGPLDVVVNFMPPINNTTDRKTAAIKVEAAVRHGWSEATKHWRGAA